MPDAPLVTITDPSGRGRPRPVEPEAGPRGPGRRTALGIVVVLVAAGALVSVREVSQQRAEQRAEDEAFAIADRVTLRGEVGAVYGTTTGRDELLEAEVVVRPLDGDGEATRIGDVRLRGEDLGRRRADLSGLYDVPAVVRPRAEVDCDLVATGRLPSQVEVVLELVPRSGVARQQRISVPEDALREAVVQACALTDADARPSVAAQAVPPDGLVVSVDPVLRLRRRLVLERVMVPGFSLTPSPGATLPVSLPPGTAGTYGFTLAVTDCELARGAVAVEVGLRVGAAPLLRQADEDGTAVAALLRDLVERDC